MILIDTNVIIEIWKFGNKDLIDKFNSHHIILSGIVKSELLKGARNQKDFNLIQDYLTEFDIINPNDIYWDLLGENLYNLRSNGVTVPYQDVLIATLAIQNQLTLWTFDKHFSFIQKVIPELDLLD